MTYRQVQYLRAIAAHWNGHGSAPSQRQLASELEVSESAVSQAIRSLRDEGWVSSRGDLIITATGLRAYLGTRGEVSDPVVIAVTARPASLEVLWELEHRAVQAASKCSALVTRLEDATRDVRSIAAMMRQLQ